MESAIKIRNITKKFILPSERRDTLKENVLKIFTKNSSTQFKALNEISFDVKKGEFIGIVGRNGSGKSTLLKIIAGIYKADNGSIAINGSIAPFLELGIGFQQELTARQNIFINSALLGMSRKLTKEKFNNIVDFAEVRSFLDLKIKNFSSGMRARLAFAIAKEADKDIYLCDEVLAVGDIDFQKKCIEVFKNWNKQGKTIILVSHNNEQIKDLCDKVVVLEEGKKIFEGKTKITIDKYESMFYKRDT